MTDTLPLTAIIPSYNRAGMLERAIESIRSQVPAPPAEILVVDDASSDGTAETAERLGARVIRHDTNRGAAESRNTGLRAASHPWVAMLDSDDEWLPHHLATLWPLREGYDLVAGSSVFTDAAGVPRAFHGPVADGPVILPSPAALYPVNVITASGVLVRRDPVLALGGYRTDLRYAEDLDLWIRMLDRRPAIATPEVVTRYGLHDGQKSQDARTREAQLRIVDDYRDRPWWSPRLRQRQLAFRAWDAFRAALRAGERRVALEELRWLLAHPARLRALAELLRHRRGTRRKLAALRGAS